MAQFGNISPTAPSTSLESNLLSPEFECPKNSENHLNSNPRQQVMSLQLNYPGRRDVVYKSLMRDMRKFYKNDFNQKTGYINKKLARRDKSYAEMVRHYIQQTMPALLTIS
jgi:hypothetical protein